MSVISDEEKDQVRAASDLVAIVQETVELKPRGHEFWGCCPFHDEKTPSFHIIPATQVWHCFGCGEGGDVFTYIMKRENLSFPESIRYLADRAGIELHDTGDRRERGTKRARIYDLCAETAHVIDRDARGAEGITRNAEMIGLRRIISQYSIEIQRAIAFAAIITADIQLVTHMQQTA